MTIATKEGQRDIKVGFLGEKKRRQHFDEDYAIQNLTEHWKLNKLMIF